MRRLYLHIGYPKTGTTSIQRFMAENTGRLAEAGVLYPRTGRSGDAHYALNFAMGIGAYDRPATLEIPPTLRQDLRHEVDDSRCDRVVVSSEYFAAASLDDKAKVKQFFSDFDVKVVVYLRRHDLAFESAYGQSVKSVANPPWSPTIESFILYQLGMGTVSYDYLNVLRQWASAFGQSAIVVRPFERSQNVPDIFGDFLQAIGSADSEAYVRPGSVNASLSPQIVAAIQAVRKTSVSPQVKAQLVGQLIRMGEASSSRQAYLSPAMRVSIVKRYAPSYRTIAKEFMNRADASIFTESMPRQNDPWEPPPPASPEATLDLVLQAVAGCLS